jgi:hypothetical protein
MYTYTADVQLADDEVGLVAIGYDLVNADDEDDVVAVLTTIGVRESAVPGRYYSPIQLPDGRRIRIRWHDGAGYRSAEVVDPRVLAATGSGRYIVEVTVMTDPGPGPYPVASASVTIQQAGMNVAWGYTGHAGEPLALSLVPGTYQALVAGPGPGWAPLPPQALVVAANMAVEYELVQQAPAPPTALPGYCNVLVDTLDLADVVVVGAMVTARALTLPMRTGTVLVGRAPLTASTDVFGRATLAVPASPQFAREARRWLFECPELGLSAAVEVPDEGEVWLAALMG